jgi:opacity protein-like surface antigen
MRLISLRTTMSAMALVLLGGATLPAAAQNSGKGYLLRTPEARITVRGGYALATAKSDLFDFTIEELTLKRSDFSGFTGGVELAVAVASRWEVSLDAGYSRAHKGSSFRKYIDNNDQEIEQTTTFERVPLTLNARYYLAAPGRSIGKLAWIPTHIVPWVGAGGGTMYYRFIQRGDWVDYQTFNVFSDDFESDSWAPALQGMGGFDISLSPMLAITTEARYIWARGSLRRDFNGFNRIDLSGASATFGLTVRM